MTDEKDYTGNGLVPDNIFMSKRLQVATMTAQGILAHYGFSVTFEQVAEDAFNMADALIAQEHNDEQTRQKIL